jgi:flavin-dependent dehydrogenase
VEAPITADVLVIGGGPAGAATAITCARAGLSVALIESSPFPRHRPGETLHPGIEPLLERLGAAGSVRRAAFIRHPGVWLEEQSGCAHFQPYGEDARGPWLGFQAPRAEFDSLLLDTARSLGVVIHQPHRALRVMLEGRRVTGAETTAGIIRAAFTVDASGSASWLARQLALPVGRASRRLVALYGYFRGSEEGARRALDDAPRFKWMPDGWIWTARVRPGLYHWTRLLATNADLRRGWSPTEFAGLQPVGKVKGADVSWRIVDRCAGAGYFIVGDAASVTDPSSSNGVLHAIMSGMLAGNSAARCILGNTAGRPYSLEYSNFINSWFWSNFDRVSGLIPAIRTKVAHDIHIALDNVLEADRILSQYDTI